MMIKNLALTYLLFDIGVGQPSSGFECTSSDDMGFYEEKTQDSVTCTFCKCLFDSSSSSLVPDCVDSSSAFNDITGYCTLSDCNSASDFVFNNGCNCPTCDDDRSTNQPISGTSEPQPSDECDENDPPTFNFDECEFTYCGCKQYSPSNNCIQYSYLTENSLTSVAQSDSDLVSDYCNCDSMVPPSSWTWDNGNCECPNCTPSTTEPKNTNSGSDNLSTVIDPTVIACSEDDNYFTLTTYSNVEECQLCYCEPSSHQTKCEAAQSMTLENTIRNECNIENSCNVNDFDWGSDDYCGCPTCSTDDNNTPLNTKSSNIMTTYTITKDVNNNNNNDDDDDVFDSNNYNYETPTETDSYSLEATVSIQFNKIWNSRSEIWSVLQQALFRICSATTQDTTNVDVYISYFAISEVDDNIETTEAPIMRRRLLRNLLQTNKPNPINTIKTTQIYFLETNSNNNDDNSGDNTNDDDITYEIEVTLLLYDSDDTKIETWYNTLIDLGTQFSDDFGTNCQDVSGDTDPSGIGFGPVTVTSAAISYTDADGNVIESVSYGDDGDDSDEVGNTGDANIFGIVNNISFVTICGIVVLLWNY